MERLLAPMDSVLAVRHTRGCLEAMELAMGQDLLQQPPSRTALQCWSLFVDLPQNLL
jgi:hypothetical protein